jgi:DNA repair exonuclease SbcCD ATPase subunit
MNPQADVSSIPVLQDWHAALCTFRSDAADVLAAVQMEIRHAFDWISEQLKEWQRAVREREEDVIQAKADLARREIPDHTGKTPDATVQKEKLRQAQARLHFALNQVDVCRRWLQKLPRMINEEYEGHARRLSAFIDTVLPQALASLQQQIASLEAYTQIKAESIGPVAPPSVLGKEQP